VSAYLCRHPSPETNSSCSTINQSKPEVSDEARESAQERLDKM
jgi:hypothetical protein